MTNTKVRIGDLKTREETLERHWEIVARLNDRIAANESKINYLLKRITDHRKAKNLANRRADLVVKECKNFMDKLSNFNG